MVFLSLSFSQPVLREPFSKLRILDLFWQSAIVKLVQVFNPSEVMLGEREYRTCYVV